MKAQETFITIKPYESLELTTEHTESTQETITVIVKEGATFKHTIIAQKNCDISLDYRIFLEEKNASAEVQGRLYLKKNTKQSWNIKQTHKGIATTSNVNVKAVLDDQSSFAYQGTITIEKTALESKAHQEQKNILLSKHAHVTSVPNLQVLTHKVACGHGSAVSYLDDEMLFYLTLRGLSSEKAKQLIIESFLSL